MTHITNKNQSKFKFKDLALTALEVLRTKTLRFAKIPAWKTYCMDLQLSFKLRRCQIGKPM